MPDIVRPESPRAITLTLRHLWTRTGGPLSWTFAGGDERELRDLLGRLDEFVADPAEPSAVLIAVTDGDDPLGAWNREGAARLRFLIEATLPQDEMWWGVRHALLDGVTAPIDGVTAP